MSERIQCGFISITPTDMDRFRETQGELGFNPNGAELRESPNLVLNQLSPEVRERIENMALEGTCQRVAKAKEKTELQSLFDEIQRNKGSILLRDVIRSMSSLLGYRLDTILNIRHGDSVGQYQPYRVSGLNKINFINDYCKVILTFLVDQHKDIPFSDLITTYHAIHEAFHQARLQQGYGNVYMDLTEKDTLHISGVYKHSDGTEAITRYLKLKLRKNLLSVERFNDHQL